LRPGSVVTMASTVAMAGVSVVAIVVAVPAALALLLAGLLVAFGVAGTVAGPCDRGHKVHRLSTGAPVVAIAVPVAMVLFWHVQVNGLLHEGHGRLVDHHGLGVNHAWRLLANFNATMKARLIHGDLHTHIGAGRGGLDQGEAGGQGEAPTGQGGGVHAWILSVRRLLPSDLSTAAALRAPTRFV
jgi:hypothetical protein